MRSAAEVVDDVMALLLYKIKRRNLNGPGDMSTFVDRMADSQESTSERNDNSTDTLDSDRGSQNSLLGSMHGQKVK